MTSLGAQTPATAEPLSVPDIIGMTLFSSNAHNGASDDVHVLSPDGTRVAVVVQRGNLAKNTVDYALLVFSTSTQPTEPRPDTLLVFSATTNAPAIAHVAWLNDGRTLAFLGAEGHALPQVFTIDLATHAATARTHSSTGVTWYTISANGEPIIYQERGRVDTSDYAGMRAKGFAVDRSLWPSDLILGDFRGVVRNAENPSTYRIARGGGDRPLNLPDSSTDYRHCEIQPWYGAPLSPSGDALLIGCDPRTPPAWWKAYRNPRYRLFADQWRAVGQQLVLLDLASGQARRVYDAPLLLQAETNWAWAPDGRSIVLSTALLPLTGPDSARRLSSRMVVELDLMTRAFTTVVPRDSLIVRDWNPRTGVVEFAQAPAWFEVNDATQRVFYRKDGRGWRSVAALAPRFLVREDPNTPPRLMAVDPATRRSRVVFDPNRTLFDRRRLGRVEVTHYTSKSGRKYAAGVYYPPDFSTGHRYPLVIQTHGYDSTTFSPDGPFTSGTAAQPLAGSGIVVAQAAELISGNDAVDGTPEEGPSYQDMWEGLIDELDRRGVIDRARIGLHGFSRTCFAALYFLTHSSYPIAAADLTDGVDYSYLQFLVYRG
ncbi:MAG TPA: hypothetical protein VG454_03905, partial [Gemmatimonadales bacterium]|nr:hypothetical protein [Gemmatimonadales bacterium]